MASLKDHAIRGCKIKINQLKAWPYKCCLIMVKLSSFHHFLIELNLNNHKINIRWFLTKASLCYFKKLHFYSSKRIYWSICGIFFWVFGFLRILNAKNKKLKKKFHKHSNWKIIHFFIFLILIFFYFKASVCSVIL